MPFKSVPCSIWLAHLGPKDAYGNASVEYEAEPDLATRCCYAPGTSRPDTTDDMEDGRPYGDVATMTFFLPKEVDADLRQARIACYPASDASMYGKLFAVVGEPYSYQRENTPGDYSWRIEAVRADG